MKELKLTEELIGYFDVRKYIANKNKKECPILPAGSNISFMFTTNTLKDDYKQYARAYTNKNGEQNYAVNFKIGINCRWYNENSKEIERPSNEDLDGKLCKARIQYATLDGNPDLKEATGYWAKAIQYQVLEVNPFVPFLNSKNQEENQEENQKENQEENQEVDMLPW